MIHIVYETPEITKTDVTKEEGGTTLVLQLENTGESSQSEEAPELFIRVHSVDPSGKHRALTGYGGKKFRVEITEIPPVEPPPPPPPPAKAVGDGWDLHRKAEAAVMKDYSSGRALVKTDPTDIQMILSLADKYLGDLNPQGLVSCYGLPGVWGTLVTKLAARAPRMTPEDMSVVAGALDTLTHSGNPRSGSRSVPQYERLG